VQYWKMQLYSAERIKGLGLCGRVLRGGEEMFYFTTLPVAKII
jgi:hypothetical protein